MIDKRTTDVATAICDIKPGSTLMIGGFGEAGAPTELICCLVDRGVGELTVVSNNAGSAERGLATLIGAGLVSKMICSYPRSTGGGAFTDLYRAGRIDLELVPQGTLAERIRAGGSGIPAFYTPTGVGTLLADGKERRCFAGREYLLEHAIVADVALIKAAAADWHGNLLYNKTARNFSPLMATAARTTVVQADEVVPPGALDPETVVTPGIFVDHVLDAARLAAEFENTGQSAGSR